MITTLEKAALKKIAKLASQQLSIEQQIKTIADECSIDLDNLDKYHCEDAQKVKDAMKKLNFEINNWE